MQLQSSDCGDADRAFGYTNFKIKLKSDHGVIDRKFPNVIDNEVSQEEEEDNTISDLILPKQGGPTRFDPLRQVKVPMVFILNERFENPKFKSRHPRRKKLKNFTLPITNEIVTELENEVRKEKPIKRKPKLKQKLTGNHANILNTNFRFAFLKRMKQKLAASSGSTSSITKTPLRRRSRKIKRVRKKL